VKVDNLIDVGVDMLYGFDIMVLQMASALPRKGVTKNFTLGTLAGVFLLPKNPLRKYLLVYTAIF